MVPYFVQIAPYMVVGLICGIAGALAYPLFCRLEDWVLERRFRRNPMMKDVAYRRLVEEIGIARLKHKPVKHLLKRQAQMVRDAITAKHR